MKTIKPFGKYIMVEPFKDMNSILGNDALSEYGKVTAIGPEVEKIQVGDTIGFSVFGVEKLIISDEVKYYFIAENTEFLLCTIEE